MKGPVASLTWLLIVSGNLDKTLVQAQVVTNGILPALSATDKTETIFRQGKTEKKNVCRLCNLTNKHV